MNFSVAKHFLLYLSICSVVGLASCEPCEDCGPENAYPYFNFTVLNRTSLDTLLAIRDTLQVDLDTVNSNLDDEAFIEARDSLNDKKEVLSDSISLMNDLIRIVNSRLLKIKSINDTEDLFRSDLRGDSLTNFKIPLSANENISSFEILIEGTDSVNQLVVSYTLTDTVINNKITKAATNLGIITHDYETISGPYGCSGNNCISNELTIYVEI